MNDGGVRLSRRRGLRPTSRLAPNLRLIETHQTVTHEQGNAQLRAIAVCLMNALRGVEGVKFTMLALPRGDGRALEIGGWRGAVQPWLCQNRP